MSKAILEARSFFKKAIHPESDFTEGFEIASPIQNPTIALPVRVQLTQKEKMSIQKILVDDYQPGIISESQVAVHVEQLTNITTQIKSISAQSILLHGERIKQAQDLLSNYREGAFSKWLMNTYRNRQTPYCMLRYYEFYQSVPRIIQAIVEAAPKKAIYLLASREGDINKKIELLTEHKDTSQSDLILLIQSTFPIERTDKRKPLNTSTIEAMSKLCLKLEARSKFLSDDDRIDIEKLILRLQKL